ncbi:MAG: hypothetical protein HY743_01200 [Deltaproteobacteria bacterium]|nr:hypothetical protein [Deltaproteobacteria bacterium]
MKICVNPVPGVTHEHIAEYLYPIHNLSPTSVRRSLRRAVKRSDIDESAALIIALKDGAEVPPEIAKLAIKRVIDVVTCGAVINGCIEIINPECTKEQAEAGENLTLLLPLAAIEDLNITYRRWEPKRRSG